MRVLRVAHHAPETSWRQRERELRRLGVDVQLISAKRWDVGGRRVTLDPGEDDFVIGGRTWGTHPSLFVMDPRPIWRALGSAPDLIDLHEEPNALITAEVLVLRAMRGSRAPVFLYSAQNIPKRYPVPFRWFERHALRTASAVYVCNTEAGDILDSKGLAGRSTYIPLGVDLSTFSASDRPIPSGASVVGYVGRLERHKGVHILLEAVAQESHLSLRIVGEGPERAGLERQARILGIDDRVEFRGFVKSSELPEIYRDFDVLVVPSVPTASWREQFCRVAVEAMSCGVPVVASRTGALPGVVGDAGLLVTPGDVRDLRERIVEAVSDPTWSTLRSRGLARAATFAWESVAASQRSLYESALAGPPSAESRGLHVVVVAYGPPAYLDACLARLGGAYPVTIVDNSSLADTRLVAERHGAEYVDAGGNVGFAAGVNKGLASLPREEGTQTDVLLLNPDALIAGSAVAAMHSELLADPRLAVIGATQTDPITGAAVRVWWPFPSPLGAWLDAFGLGRFRRARDFAIGSVLLLRAEAIDDVGFFDEAYFLYSEETDWQFRAVKRGWAIGVAEVEATHEGGATSSDSVVRETYFYASLRMFALTHYGAAGWRSFRRAMLVGARLRTLAGGRARQAAIRKLEAVRALSGASARATPHRKDAHGR